MLVHDTQVFTDSGWKPIQDVVGHTRVLVKNFAGDAEFIQPFALKKKQFSGDVYSLGAKDWSFTATGDHPVVYDIDGERKFRTRTLDEFSVTNHNKLYRKFRYMYHEEPKKEDIKIRDEFGTRSVTISPQDWYVLVAWVLMRGFIKMGHGKPMLQFYLSKEFFLREEAILGDILDRIGVQYHVQYPLNKSPMLVVSSKNTLARRLVTRLGSSTRKQMFLPDKMIYGSNKQLTKLFIETIIGIAGANKISTTNKALIDSLTLLGTLGGYSVGYQLNMKAGTVTNRAKTKNDSYILRISAPIALYSPTFKQKTTYSGYIYGLDLFDGYIYVKDRTSPVWITPK